MDWKHLLTSLEGRIGRKSYWFGVLALSVIWVIALAAGFSLLGEAFFGLPLVVIQVAMLYPFAAITAKRLHDRNRPTSFVLFLLVPSLISIVLGALGISDQENSSVIETVVGLFTLAIVVWFLVELGFMRGTPGPNAHGPDPLGKRVEDARMEA